MKFFLKDIFDDFEFTDPHKNKLRFNKKDILANYPLIYQNEEPKISFFKSLIRQHKHEYNLKISHEIDFLDDEIISDHRNIKRKNNNSKSAIIKSINGDLKYRLESFNANLEKGFHNEWDYEDSTDNKFTFSKKTSRKLINKY